ncbi:type II secretion system protein [Hydrogenovibrio halophilus]|uniref:type II secretion system protein n=1 Tax=Hydrogenovibrio halophilus TaxID=373391 RepID=UPI0003667383|nr:type II secretion system protein [Hydrogenovibrio halophilus]
MFSRDNPTCSNGFTLVEIAITLVIIGLLLSGTLKAQELIHSAQINRAIEDLKNFQVAYWSYRDRMGEIPGAMNSHSGRLYKVTSDEPTSSGEHRFFYEIHDQGFIKQKRLVPDSAIGDVYQVAYGSTANVDTHNNATIENKNQVCASGLKDPDMARQLDNKLDDGAYDDGNVRADEDYESEDISIVCLALD